MATHLQGDPDLGSRKPLSQQGLPSGHAKSVHDFAGVVENTDVCVFVADIQAYDEGDMLLHGWSPDFDEGVAR